MSERAAAGNWQEEVERRLLRRLLDSRSRTMRWKSLGALAPPGRDRVDVERVVAELEARGVVERVQRPDRRGDRRPTMLRLVSEAEALARGCAGEQRQSRGARIVAALEAMLRTPERLPIPARALSSLVFGNTTAARIADFRDEIEAALSLPFEALVRDHSSGVLSAGPFRFHHAGFSIDARAFTPWLCLPEQMVRDLEALELDAGQVLTVENQTTFEALCHDGSIRDAVLVFTSGFLGRAERAWLARLAASTAVHRVRHWGDLDPGGLLIYRQIRDLLAEAAPDVLLEPFRMEPALLDHPAAVPLSDRDGDRLRAYLAAPAPPLAELAEAMLGRGLKLEQEALLLDLRPGDGEPARSSLVDDPRAPP